MKTYNMYYTEKITDYLGRTFQERYCRVGKWQAVKYTVSGIPYITHNGRRYRLDNFYRLGSAWCPGEAFTVTDAAGRKATLHGYEMDEYYKPLFIQLDEYGEKARLFKFEGGVNE